uniref:Fibronectin type-II domain-containing protein n=1 Tax=Capra hircus TaxID=9925 RepID=A0A8C2R7S7_CAPHI
MAPRLGLFLIWAGAPVFLQLHPVNGERPCPRHADLQCPPCAFPFTYRRKIYYKCTSVNSEREWCSLDEDYVGRWKICRKGDYAKCVFPFIYGNKSYQTCTKTGSVTKRYWCSLSPNFDEDRAWKYC